MRKSVLQVVLQSLIVKPTVTVLFTVKINLLKIMSTKLYLLKIFVFFENKNLIFDEAET
jgi:hypothetical protein